jgi:hypothetical protein
LIFVILRPSRGVLDTGLVSSIYRAFRMAQRRAWNSAMDKKYSKHQQRIIKNYYENREAISLQRLSELVTELYLAEGKARERQWKYIIGVLEKLGLPEERIEHLRKKDDPRLLAKLVEELMAKQK